MALGSAVEPPASVSIGLVGELCTQKVGAIYYRGREQVGGVRLHAKANQACSRLEETSPHWPPS